MLLLWRRHDRQLPFVPQILRERFSSLSHPLRLVLRRNPLRNSSVDALLQENSYPAEAGASYSGTFSVNLFEFGSLSPSSRILLRPLRVSALFFRSATRRRWRTGTIQSSAIRRRCTIFRIAGTIWRTGTIQSSATRRRSRTGTIQSSSTRRRSRTGTI